MFYALHRRKSAEAVKERIMQNTRSKAEVLIIPPRPQGLHSGIFTKRNSVHAGRQCVTLHGLNCVAIKWQQSAAGVDYHATEAVIEVFRDEKLLQIEVHAIAPVVAGIRRLVDSFLSGIPAPDGAVD